MKSLNNGDWSQSRFKIIIDHGFHVVDFRFSFTSNGLLSDFNARNMTYDLIIVTKYHGSRSCVTEGQVKQSSPGKESINKC